MKITCDNCGAVYRIPEEKLTKDVSRATCKKCGSKLIIRRPSEGQEGYEDPRLGGMQGGDEDSVINHEERTVIAVVPELQKFDAVPPLAGGPGSPQDVLGMLSSAAAGGTSPVVAKTTSDTTLAEEPRKIGSQASAKTTSAPPAKSPTPTPVVGPNITASTSPLRPSGEAPPPPPPPPRATQAPVGAAATTPTSTRPDVVQMFANQSNKPASTQEFQQPASRLSLVLLAIALVGVLLFIDKGLWGLTRMTAVGFILAVYGIVAAFLAQWDLARTGKINFVKVFLVPAAVCAGLIAALWSAQKDEVAFLHQEWKPELVTQIITEHLQAPDAEKESLATVLARRASGGERYAHRGPRNSNPALPNPDALPEIGSGKPGDMGSSAEPGLKSGAGTGSPDVAIGGVGIVPTHVKHEVAALPMGGKSEVQLDEAGISRTLDEARVRTCFTTSAGGLNLPGRVVLRIVMAPDGTPKKAHIVGNDQLSQTKLEQCMVDRVMKAHFPSFEASTPQSFDAPFVL